MAEVDTSSYPKANMPQQQNMLDIAGKLGSMQQQKIAIDQAKFNLARDHYDKMISVIAPLSSDPELSPDKVTNTLDYMTKMGLITPDQNAKTRTQLPSPMQLQQNPSLLKQTVDGFLMQTQSAQKMFESRFGVMQQIRDNAGTGSFVSNPRSQTINPAGGNASYIQDRLGVPDLSKPAVTGFDPQGAPEIGTERLRLEKVDPQALRTPSPFNAPTPTARPADLGQQPGNQLTGGAGAMNRAPAPQGANPLVGTSQQAPAPADLARRMEPTQRAQFTEKLNNAGKPITQPLPQAVEQRQKDLQNASRLSGGLQPLGMAIEMLSNAKPGTAGPTSQAINEVKNFLVSVGAADPNSNIANEAVARDMINKYLNQQIASAPGFNRSDASQAFAASSNPNLSSSTKAALELSRTVYALNKMQAAMPSAFKGKNINDYPEFTSKWMAEQDPKAFGIEVMDKAEAAKLIKKMQDPKVINTAQGQKFWNSMLIAHPKK